MVEAGLFDPHNVWDGAQLAHTVRTHDDAELGGVVKHDGQVGIVGQQPDVFDHLVLCLGGHIWGCDDQEIEAFIFSMLGQRDHLIGVGVCYVGSDGPGAFGCFGNGVHHLDALIVGQRPELAHVPGAAGAGGAQAADMADVPFDAIYVDEVIGSEWSDECGPLPLQGIPSPVLGLMFLITRHYLIHPP